MYLTTHEATDLVEQHTAAAIERLIQAWTASDWDDEEAGDPWPETELDRKHYEYDR
jgi:hypothetical protein